jgi:hypothetical protein
MELNEQHEIINEKITAWQAVKSLATIQNLILAIFFGILGVNIFLGFLQYKSLNVISNTAIQNEEFKKTVVDYINKNLPPKAQ